MQLYDLPAPAGANKKRKRVGRGESVGKTGRGHKGQGARTGKGARTGFEGIACQWPPHAEAWLYECFR